MTCLCWTGPPPKKISQTSLASHRRLKKADLTAAHRSRPLPCLESSFTAIRRSNCPIDLQSFSPDSKQAAYLYHRLATALRRRLSPSSKASYQTRWLTKQHHLVPPCLPSSSTTFQTLFRATSAPLSHIFNQPTSIYLRVPKTPSQQSPSTHISTPSLPPPSLLVLSSSSPLPPFSPSQ